MEQPYAGIEDRSKAIASPAVKAQPTDIVPLNTTMESVKIDSGIMDTVVQLGFTEELVDKYLQAKDLNCATTSYFLLN